MLFRPVELTAIEAGEVDLAFRRWDRPRVRVGSQLRTPVGLIEVTSVDVVPTRSLTRQDALRAGAPTLAALREALAARAERPIFRVGLRFAGADPRVSLRDTLPDDAEVERIRAGLDRLDRASPIGPWTAGTLELIDENPGVRAPELAARLGRDTAGFKRDVRKLKERGLTESLDIGYRLSPRGRAYIDHGGPPRARPAPPAGTPLPRIGPGATRALRAAGLVTLEQVAAAGVDELAALPGVGPFAHGRLRSALAEAGLGGTATDA
jgi:hypothetical protein